MPKPICETVGHVVCPFCKKDVDVRWSEKQKLHFGYCTRDGKFGERKDSDAQKYILENMVLKNAEPVEDLDDEDLEPLPVDDDLDQTEDSDKEKKSEGGGVFPYFS